VSALSPSVLADAAHDIGRLADALRQLRWIMSARTYQHLIMGTSATDAYWRARDPNGPPAIAGIPLQFTDNYAFRHVDLQFRSDEGPWVLLVGEVLR